MLAEKISAWGINQLTQVIVYDQGGGMFAARLWWLLRWLGHEKVAVVDGGWPKMARGGAASSRYWPGKRASFIYSSTTGRAGSECRRGYCMSS